MNLLNLIGDIFKPAVELIDELHTSDEEKLTAKNKLMVIQAGAVSQAVDFETEQLKAKRDIIVAEAKSDSWLTANWRPLTMVGMMLSVMAYWFGITPVDPVTGLSTIPEDIVLSMFNLVKIGVGGYITSRGVEKVAPDVIAAFKKKDNV